MSDYTRVNAASMNEGIQDLYTAYSNLKATLDGLDADIKQNLAKWEGSAQTAYHEAQTSWNNDVNHMHSVVVKMKQVLDQINVDYAQTEQKIHGRFSA